MQLNNRFAYGFYQDSGGWTVEITDPIGATDARSLGIGHLLTDPLGITHGTPTQVAAYTQTRTDPLGSVDSVSQVGNIGDSRTDTTGALDSRVQVAAYARTTEGRVLIPF